MQREFQRFSSIIPQHFLRVIMAQHGKWRNPAILIINDVGCYVRQTIDLDGIPQYCGTSREKNGQICVSSRKCEDIFEYMHAVGISGTS